MRTLVFLEAADDLGLQALTFARRYDPAVEVVAFGEAPQVAAKVHVADIDPYAPQAWARAIASLGPTSVIAAGTDVGNEVLAHAAVMLDGVFAANVIAADGDQVTRQRWGGSLLEEARLHGDVKLMTVAPHSVAIEESPGEPEVLPLAAVGEERDQVARVVGRVETSSGGLSLAEAPVVVSGGRGVGSAEGFAPLEELAELLGGVVGCSRAVTSAGWRPHTDQVGQTGTKISPELYIPCGISGATQHMAGCKGAKKLLAINSDAEAPIMMSADYAVIGDVLEIVPAISAELRRVRG
ncbi:MAG TPA: electron transfer flavoprotein subunit alpha/FixB family protein [Solirubrobacteraceae bacterium]|nr:electron transfer flavoprotein subunit alpha/FixB family protein [Solirubrobacteraceae bacterium]